MSVPRPVSAASILGRPPKMSPDQLLALAKEQELKLAEAQKQRKGDDSAQNGPPASPRRIPGVRRQPPVDRIDARGQRPVNAVQSFIDTHLGGLTPA